MSKNNNGEVRGKPKYSELYDDIDPEVKQMFKIAERDGILPTINGFNTRWLR